MRISDIRLDSISFPGSNKEYIQIDDVTSKDIAIIGLNAKMPMAEHRGEFWRNIKHGIDCVRSISESRKAAIVKYLKYRGDDLAGVKYLKGAFFDNIDEYDFNFFRYAPRAASLMNPTHRLFQESVWNMIEDAGYCAEKLNGSRTGVYLGLICGLEDHKYKQIIEDVDPSLLPIAVAGNLPAMIPSRISYLLNLRGPSMVVDTACSSSLVALHLACESLRRGDCEMAIAGSARIVSLPLDRNEEKIGIESSDAITRSFDEASDGSGIGEGVVSVFLKPLHRAVSDGDAVYAVIKSTAINQDGSSAAITAPNPKAQEEVIVQAWEEAGLNPETISYIEVHGTGTKLGDIMEIEGLNAAFARYTQKRQFCAISSLKSNTGHLYEAAGLAGLVKAVLSLQNREIPAGIHFNRPNSAINFSDSPVYVNIRPRKWETNGQPRRCGVSSFGISGTNCHVVLEEAPPVERVEQVYNGIHVLTLSAKSEDALKRIITDYIHCLDTDPGLRIGDVCYTAGTGRGHYGHRLAVQASSMAEITGILKALSKEGIACKGQGLHYGYHRVVEDAKEKIAGNELTESGKRELSKEAADQVRRYLAADRKYPDILEGICRLYVQGADVEWELMYSRKGLKVRLPVYPFERDKCWINIPDPNSRDTQAKDTGWYHTLGWKAEKPPVYTGEKKNGAAIVIKDTRGIGEGIIKSLREQGREVCQIEIGSEYIKKDNTSYQVGPGEADYEKFLSEIGIDISEIIHLATVTGKYEITSLQELQESQERGVFSLLSLTKAWRGKFGDKPLNLVLVSEYTNEVTGDECTINPHTATLYGLGKAVRREYPDIACRFIDIDKDTTVDEIIKEIDAQEKTYGIAYRKGTRYVEQFKVLDIVTTPGKETPIRENGVYIITGGAGGIGVEAAKWLGSLNRGLKIILIGRTVIGGRDEWEEIVRKNEKKELCRKIQGIREIEETKSAVTYINVDIADAEEVKKVLAGIRQTFSGINGIIHGAGVEIPGDLAGKRKEEFIEVLRPKVYGTWIMDHLTRADKLDFFIMFSSIATIFNTFGQGDYVAANAYLDAYAALRNKTGNKSLTINWSTWRETGMAARRGINFDAICKTLSTGRAIDKLAEVLNSDATRVLIGEINYNSRIAGLIGSYPFSIEDRIKNKLAGTQGRGPAGKFSGKHNSREVQITGRDNAEYTGTEREIAAICKEVLGFAEINIHENFFESGADSILLRQIHQRLDKIFPGRLAVTDFFQYSTIAKLAAYIAEQKNIGEKAPGNSSNIGIDKQLDSIFEEIGKGKLSIDDAVGRLTAL